MNRIISTFSAIVLTFTLFVVVVFAAITEKMLRVNGMTCGGCAASVEQALKKVDGVVEVKATPGPKGRVWVKYDDKKVELARIKQVIKDAGFEVVAE